MWTCSMLVGGSTSSFSGSGSDESREYRRFAASSPSRSTRTRAKPVSCPTQPTRKRVPIPRRRRDALRDNDTRLPAGVRTNREQRAGAAGVNPRRRRRREAKIGPVHDFCRSEIGWLGQAISPSHTEIGWLTPRPRFLSLDPLLYISIIMVSVVWWWCTRAPTGSGWDRYRLIHM